MSAFAGHMASLVAGAGGISVDSGGDVKLRTADHSVEIDPNGPARLMSRNDLTSSSKTLNAVAGEVAVSGGSSSAEIARLTVQLDCLKTPGACESSDAAMIDELAGMLGVSADRLRIREVSGISTSPPTSTPSGGSPVTLENTARIPGQFGRRAQEKEADNNDNDGYGLDRPDHLRSAKQLDAIKKVKKRLMKQLLSFFDKNRLDKDVRKYAMMKVLQFSAENDVLRLWKHFRGADGDISPDMMRTFVDSLGHL